MSFTHGPRAHLHPEYHIALDSHIFLPLLFYHVLEHLQAPLPKSSINPNNPVEVLRGVSGELDRMQALVNKEVGRFFLSCFEFATYRCCCWFMVSPIQAGQSLPLQMN